MADKNFTVYFSGQIDAKLTKWKVKVGSRMPKGQLIAIFEPLYKQKSADYGIVKKLLVEEGATVELGQPIIEAEVCDHPVVMKDMCAECGADLRSTLGCPGDRKENATASVAMIHSIPELIVSEQEALDIGKADETNLLSSNKLVLLVDLDQTLIHTTNDNIPPNLKDVIHFQLPHGDTKLWYHTRLRPGTQKFLEKMSKLYELHICTFGVRLYAHTIASHLDPEQKLFSHRILSRDECFSPVTKTANLKALFPRGDSMVCIIDDREDVWNYAPNLVHVKPYRFFRGTADINAPPGMDKTEENTEKVLEPAGIHKEMSPESGDCHSQKKDDICDSKKIESAGDNESDSKDESKSDSKDESKSDDKDESKSDDKDDSNSDDKNDSKSVDKKESKSEDSKESMSEDPKESKSDNKKDEKEWIEWDDNDDYLIYLEDILKNIHKAYFQMNSEYVIKGEKGVPDLKNIIPYVRKKVLKGCNIVFSGIIPINMPPDKNRAYQIARAFGANIQQTLQLSGDSDAKTTHVIAAKLGTAKVDTALKDKSVHVVTIDWLWCCAYRWERVAEELFVLNKNSQTRYGCDSPDPSKQKKSSKRKAEDEANSGSNPLEKRPKSVTPKPSRSDPLRLSIADLNPMYALSKEDLEQDEEFRALMEEESSSSSSSAVEDEDEDRVMDRKLRQKVLSGEDEDSSSGESLSGEYPRGWKGKAKRDRKLMKMLSQEEGEDDAYEVRESENEQVVQDLELSSSGSDSDEKDQESIGSVDEEMAEALQREIMKY